MLRTGGFDFKPPPPPSLALLSTHQRSTDLQPSAGPRVTTSISGRKTTQKDVKPRKSTQNCGTIHAETMHFRASGGRVPGTVDKPIASFNRAHPIYPSPAAHLTIRQRSTHVLTRRGDMIVPEWVVSRNICCATRRAAIWRSSRASDASPPRLSRWRECWSRC